jgi:hypothetical protein
LVADRYIAVDWSGRATGEHRFLWIAEVSASSDEVVDLRSASRSEARDHLLSRLGSGQVAAVGLDLAFSFPLWFLDQLGVWGGPDLWALVADEGERWLAACDPPFWGRPGRRRPELAGPHFRRTEEEVPSIRAIRPKSVFQIGGAGAVGTGSLRGMPLLSALHGAGGQVWPFTDSDGPMVVEVWPRSCTGPVVKSRLANEHAADATATALVMARELRDLPPPRDDVDRREGRIWVPRSTVA